MKKLVAMLVVFISISLVAQQEDESRTLFCSSFLNGSEIGLSINSTTINAQNVLLLGGYGGKYLSKNIFIGGGGYGLAQNTAITVDNQTQFLKFAYGGIILGYLAKATSWFSYGINTLFGVGTISYDNYNFDNFVSVGELGLKADIQLLENVGIVFNGGYRAVNGVKLEGLNNKNLSSPFIAFNIKFGGI